MKSIDTPTKLKAARKRLGLTQAQMAHELGITLSGYQRMEYGERPIERRTDLAVRYLATDRHASNPPQS